MFRALLVIFLGVLVPLKSHAFLELIIADAIIKVEERAIYQSIKSSKGMFVAGGRGNRLRCDGVFRMKGSITKRNSKFGYGSVYCQGSGAAKAKARSLSCSQGWFMMGSTKSNGKRGAVYCYKVKVLTAKGIKTVKKAGILPKAPGQKGSKGPKGSKGSSKNYYKPSSKACKRGDKLTVYKGSPKCKRR